MSDARDGANPSAELHLAVNRPSPAVRDPAVALDALNSPTEHDHLPVAANTGGAITPARARHDAPQATPWSNPKSDLCIASSPDGVTRAAPVKITGDPGGVVRLVPGLFRDSAGPWQTVRLSTRRGTRSTSMTVFSRGRRS